MRRVNFTEHPTGSDWTHQFRFGAGPWDLVNDEVVLSLDPDFASWDDYGFRSRTFPPAGGTAPFWSASSADFTGFVTLTDPNTIDLFVPYGVINSLGPGRVEVTLSYRRADLGTREAILLAMLPLIGGR